VSDRLRARIVTGRLGHLYGGVADWFTLVGKLLAARVRRRRR
jgi:hypothetical protein